MNVIVLKEKLDALAEAIGIKSKVRLPLTIDEQIEAVNLIKTDPKLQDKSVSLTPKTSAQTATVTADSGYDGLGAVEVEVKETPLMDLSIGTIDRPGSLNFTPSAPNIGFSEVSLNVPNGTMGTMGVYSSTYVTQNNVRKWRVHPYTRVSKAGWFWNSNYYGAYYDYNAVPANTVITPTTETQTIGAANTMLEGAITVNPIPNNYGLITYNGTTITVS